MSHEIDITTGHAAAMYAGQPAWHGLGTVIAGICLVVLGVRNLRRRWSRFGQIVRYSQRRQEYDDDGWEPA